MSGASRNLARFLAILVLLGAGQARGDGREGVEQFRSGEVTVNLEWFAPAVRGRFPTVVLLHGSGGLDPGTAAVFRDMARDFAERGYVVLIPHYFEGTGHIVGAALKKDELAAFVKTVEDAVEFGIGSGIVDEERIGMVGYSMGAYIAFFRGARDPRIKAIVSCSGSLPVESKATLPPVLILQGSNDRSNPVSRVTKFQEALKAKGTPYASHIYKGMGHNFDVERWEDAAGRAAAFFDRHMRRSKNANLSARKAQRGRLRKDSGKGVDTRKVVADGDARKPGGVDAKGRGDDARKDQDGGPDHQGQARKKDGEPGDSQVTGAALGAIWEAMSCPK